MPVGDTENTREAGVMADVDRWTVHRRPSLEAVTELLRQADLPTQDLAGELEHFFGAGSGGRLDGAVGLELFAGVALLRSLAVAPEAQGRGLGRTLVEAAEQYARVNGVRRLFLLTQTAEGFFRSLGYGEAERSTAPEEILRTQEFSEICPASASFMVKEL